MLFFGRVKEYRVVMMIRIIGIMEVKMEILKFGVFFSLKVL